MAFFNEASANVIQHISLPLEAVGFILVILEVYYPATITKIESNIQELNRNFKSKIISIQANLPDGLTTMVVMFFLLFDALREIRPPRTMYLYNERDWITPRRSYLYKEHFQREEIDNGYHLYNSTLTTIIKIVIVMVVCYKVFYAGTPIAWYAWIGYIFAWIFLNLRLLLILRSILFSLLYFGYFLVVYARSLPVWLVSSTIMFLNRVTNGKAFASVGLMLGTLGLLGEIYQVITLHVGE